MKIKLITILTAILTPIIALSHPVIQRTKSCGGVFGYQYVSKTLVENNSLSSGWGWVIECTGRGFSACPKKGNTTVLNDNVNDNQADNYDLAVGEDLVDLAELAISNGSLSGVSTVTKQVLGQNFSRVYTVTWSSTPVTCSDESAESIEIKFNVDVVYIK